MVLLTAGLMKDLPPFVVDQVTLGRVGQYVHIQPFIPRLDLIFYSAYHKPANFVTPPPAVFRIVDPLIFECKDVHDMPYWAAFAGLDPLLRELFERAGIEVVLKGKRPEPLPPPDLERLDGLAPHDAALLEFVRSRERGLIRFPGGGEVCPARLIAQIALAYSELRIAVAATRNADARAVARELAAYGVKDARAGRVLTGTYLDLLEQKKALPRLDVYFALNPTELIDSFMNAGVECVRRLDRARLYGIVPDELRVAPRIRDHLTALFSMEETYVPKHGYHAMPVEAAFVPMYGGSRPPDHRDDQIVKQFGVHEHHLRNRRVVRLAQAVADGDIALLKAQFADVAALGKKRVSGRVGVLVDHVEHGLLLAAKLGWPLVAGPTVNEQGLSAEQQAILVTGREKKQRTKESVVVTATGMAHAGRFDLVIRADAGTGLPPIPEAKMRVRNGQDRRLLVIDFLDRHHPVLRKWSRQRQEAYRGAGWGVVGETPPSPLDRFLATRPEVLR